MIEAVIFALALGTDAFAVSIGLGAQHCTKTIVVALPCALYFGLFQAGMSLYGYLGGQPIAQLARSWLDDYASKVASILLLFIGSKMIYDVVVEDVNDSRPGQITIE